MTNSSGAWRRNAAFVALLLLTFGWVSWFVFRTIIDIRITSGSEFANILQLPRFGPSPAFVGQGHDKYQWGSEVEFRQVEGDENTLLLRVFQKDNGNYYYADTAVALDCQQRVSARPASDQLWRKAPVSVWDREKELAAFRDGNSTDDGKVFTFDGKQFRHSGIGVECHLSPNKRRLAMFSGDRLFRQGTYYATKSDFKFFIEVYDIASVRLLASAEGRVRSFEASVGSIGYELAWISDRYLSMPLSEEHDKLLLFDFRN